MIAKQSVLTNLDFKTLSVFKTGKVRSVYDFGEELLLVASDRVSAFDFILPDGIPGKGALLTALSKFWFDKTTSIIGNHLISTDVADFPEETKPYHQDLAGRSMYVKKTELLPIECVVRGYIIGSGWKDYQKTGEICGIELPKGLQQAQELAEPIFTPAFKAEQGEHDENISFEKMIDIVGVERANYLKEVSLKLYALGRDYAKSKGIILADTKFEFGVVNDEIILIDEVLTSDSSRYWDAHEYQVGMSPPSFDKQIVRDYLQNCGWNKQAPAPNLPEDIIEKVANRYNEVLERLNA